MACLWWIWLILALAMLAVLIAGIIYDDHSRTPCAPVGATDREAVL